jgi:hypothetical protein
MYSFRMSFCTVPESFSDATPWRSATAMYRQSRMDAVALIVIEVDTRSRGIASSSSCMSAMLEIATPTLPASLCAIGWSASYPI